MNERTSPTERYARGFAAALIAVATLVLAANAGPARAANDSKPTAQIHQTEQAEQTQQVKQIHRTRHSD
ncbi:hypothetical protein ACFY2T_22825 [Streptomyces sp. NPDC001260]|uniref:hypothetical protein n=1 Tax=Streptomyces sp. NPDC001260 TaxID=3364551 RepID=UPI0036AD4C79